MHILNAINVNSLFLETKSLGQLGSLIILIESMCQAKCCLACCLACCQSKFCLACNAFWCHGATKLTILIMILALICTSGACGAAYVFGKFGNQKLIY